LPLGNVPFLGDESSLMLCNQPLGNRNACCAETASWWHLMYIVRHVLLSSMLFSEWPATPPT
jgi:hypothetical protein